MEIGKRFKQDFGYYVLGLLVPGLINVATIPLLKNFLGPASFGIYGIRFNLLLLLVAFTVGWLNQTIIRFKFGVVDGESLFYKKVFSLALIILIFVGLVSVALNLFFYQNGILYSILFFTGLIFCGFQNILISIAQANFLSRFTMYSEAVRTGTFFISATLFLYLKWLPSIETLFLALNISYLTSGCMLFFKNRLHKLLWKHTPNASTDIFKTSTILQYGLPLALWYLVSYLMLFLDKPLLASQLGHDVQGHYQALYELISKGAVLVLIPVTYALFPLLANAFESNDEEKGIKLLKKIILIELPIMAAGLFCYWWLGFSLLQYMLNIPDTFDYKVTGLLMLASTFIWQIGILVHKPFEMRKHTFMLLWCVLAALCIFLISLFMIKWLSVNRVYYFTLPFLGASITYVAACLIVMGHLRKFSNHWKTMKKLVSSKRG